MTRPNNNWGPNFFGGKKLKGLWWKLKTRSLKLALRHLSLALLFSFCFLFIPRVINTCGCNTCWPKLLGHGSWLVARSMSSCRLEPVMMIPSDREERKVMKEKGESEKKSRALYTPPRSNPRTHWNIVCFAFVHTHQLLFVDGYN